MNKDKRNSITNWFDDEEMVLHSFIKPKRLSLFNRILNCSNGDLTPINLLSKDENYLLDKVRKFGSIKKIVKLNKKEKNLILPPITVGNAKCIKKKKTLNKKNVNILIGEDRV